MCPNTSYTEMNFKNVQLLKIIWRKTRYFWLEMYSSAWEVLFIRKVALFRFSACAGLFAEREKAKILKLGRLPPLDTFHQTGLFCFKAIEFVMKSKNEECWSPGNLSIGKMLPLGLFNPPEFVKSQNYLSLCTIFILLEVY